MQSFRVIKQSLTHNSLSSLGVFYSQSVCSFSSKRNAMSCCSIKANSGWASAGFNTRLIHSCKGYIRGGHQIMCDCIWTSHDVELNIPSSRDVMGPSTRRSLHCGENISGLILLISLYWSHAVGQIKFVSRKKTLLVCVISQIVTLGIWLEHRVPG